MTRAPHLKPYHFQKGKSGNPGGSPKLPEELRAIKSLTMIEVRRLVAKYARMNRSEVQKAVADPNTAMVELTIASIFVQCAKYGDYSRLAFLLDRSIGKPPESADLDDDAEDYSAMSTEQLLQIVQEKIPTVGKPE